MIHISTTNKKKNPLSPACFLKDVILTLLTMIGVVSVCAQDPISEGYYYLENKQNNNTGYYLVPAKSDDKTSAYYHANETTPFITTFKTNKDDNSIWYLEKVNDGSDTYYRFIHCLTGQYITFNEAVDKGFDNSTARRRVHMETFATPSDMTVFWIGKRDSDGRLAVRHKDQYDTQLNYYFWDVGDGNKDNYWSGAFNGTLGLWQKLADINNAYLWIPYTETKDLCLPPVITYDEWTRNVTISYPVADATGVTIHYTTDGSEPTTSSTTYTSPFTLPAGATKIKAIAMKGSFTNPTTRVYNVNRCVTPVITNDEGKITITTTTEGATIYYALNGQDPTPHATSATTKYTAMFDLGIETDVSKIRAIAVMEDDETSASDCAELEILQCEKPNITNSIGTITMSTATEGAEIHYVDNNNNPRYSHTKYTEPYTLGITQGPKTIYARAFKAGYRPSEVESLEYKKLDTPKITAVNADGSLKLTPTSDYFRYATSTTYTAPGDPGWGQANLVPNSNVVLPIGTDVKIVKIRAYKLGNGYSDVLTYFVPVCDAPIISVSGSTVTITCAESGAEIWYSTTSDGNDFVQYTAPFEKTTDIVRAYTRKVGFNNSGIVALQPTVTVSSTDEMTYMGGSYKLSADFVVKGSLGTADNPFTGEIDGQLNTIKGTTTHPLIAYARDAVVHDVIIEKADISGDNITGAICNEADGATRIYNCGVLSGTVSGTNYVGGLVGKLDGESRVINCYSFADITGGKEVAGIVGYNNIATTQDIVKTMVMNCMFYGDLPSTATTRHPVYGGKVLANNAEKGVNNYNYYRDEADLGGTLSKNDYYCSWPAEELHLTRFEYFRSLLNSNRELCAWWITGDYHNTDVVAKWVLDTAIAPYPVLKAWGRYPSVINRDPAKQNKLGTLTVTINSGINGGDKSTTLSLPITDMDEANHDYGYYKVQLPYYNTTFGNPDAADWTIRYAGNYTDKVVTGWKVTSVMGGTPGTFVTDREADNAYNFADRYCTSKDLYDVSGRVFAQGGYYYVPEGVTAITIEAYWGQAIYLQNRDHYLDRVNIYSNACGSAFTPTGKRPTTFQGRSVYQKIVDAINQTGTTGTVYDYAIVLIGNVQHYNHTDNDMQGNDNDHRFSLMSADLDFDDEPDYCMQLQLGENSNDANLAAARFDFLTIVPLGEAVKLPDRERYGIAIFRFRGFFEVTETSMFTSTEFNYEQYNNGYIKADGSPFILNGGQFPEEFISSKNACTADRTLYFIVGGNATFKTLTLASHNKNAVKSRHCPISVMGGEFETVSLSGLLKSLNATEVYKDNPRLYTNGGKFGIITGAGQEAVNGNVIFRIDHSIIGELYGGGQHSVNVIEGNIDIVINNSRVDKFCGGPMMGDMKAGKTITTHATNTTFGRYYGAGNGGTAYSLDGSNDETNKNRTAVASDWWMGNNEYVPLQSKNSGYRAKYKFQIWNMPSGTVANHPSRRYLYNAQFAKTTTHDVINILEGCTFLGDFYGAGNLGAVNGNVTSTLTDCTVRGSAFGAGYSASMEPFAVYTLDDIISYPWRDANTGLCHDAVISNTPLLYTWTNTETTTPISSASHDKNAVNWLKTTVSLTNLGMVKGSCTLTIKGNSLVGGSVFGGGNESAVAGNTEVILSGDTEVLGNVYGGGRLGLVKGNSKVSLQE